MSKKRKKKLRKQLRMARQAEREHRIEQAQPAEEAVPAVKLEKPKPVKTKVRPKAPKEKRTGLFQYFNEVKLELKKVAWPARPEVIAATIVVVIAIILFGIYTGLLDYFFAWVVRQLSIVFGKG